MLALYNADYTHIFAYRAQDLLRKTLHTRCIPSLTAHRAELLDSCTTPYHPWRRNSLMHNTPPPTHSVTWPSTTYSLSYLTAESSSTTFTPTHFPCNQCKAQKKWLRISFPSPLLSIVAGSGRLLGKRDNAPAVLTGVVRPYVQVCKTQFVPNIFLVTHHHQH